MRFVFLGLHRAAACLCLLTLAVPGMAFAGPPGRSSTRATGMGGALRAAATGDAGPMLNPSGIALLRQYSVEAAYQYASLDSSHRPHIAIVDSTSGFNLAGALYYTYLSSQPSDLSKVSGHEAGFSLALPFGQAFSVGGTLKYLRIETETEALDPVTMTTNTSSITAADLTFDVGATLRPASQLALAVVGYNLADIDSPLAPVQLGWGVAGSLVTNLLLTFDGYVDFSSKPNEKPVSLMGGVEFATANNLAIRGGGGHDGLFDRGYLTAGGSAITELGALDLAISRDISGDRKGTIFAVSLRLFVPGQI